MTSSGENRIVGDTKRFWSNVDRNTPPTECWPWGGYRAADGYGRYGRRSRLVHRLVLELQGEDLSGKHVHHECGNKACVNPSHLKAMDPKAHNERVFKKGYRGCATVRPSGKKMYWAAIRQFDTKEEAVAFLKRVTDL